MIQLSTLTATGLEIPGKTAGPAAIDGLFASLLEMGTGEAAVPGGKILPDAGKVLPEGLPAAAPGMPLSLAMSLVTALKTDVEPTAPAVAKTLPGEPALALPVEVKAMDLAETVMTELVEPVSVEPVEVTAAELPDTDQPEGETAQPVIVIAPLPVALEKALVPVQAEPAAANPLPLPTQDRKVPAERQAAAQALQAPQIAEVAPTQPRVPVVALPVAALAASATAAKTAEPVAERAPGAVRETAQVTTGSTSAQPVVELKLATSADRQPAGNGDLPNARFAAPAQVMQAFEAPVMAPIATDAPAAVTNAKADFAPAAIQPHDLTTLVDRLIEARENARTASGAVTVMHADFGEVSLRFGQSDGNLTVSLANNDPGFARAVNAAVAADGGAMGNEAAFQGDRRDGGQGASTRTATDSQNSSSERGTGRERDGREHRADRSETQSQAQGQAARRARGGIFA